MEGAVENTQIEQGCPVVGDNSSKDQGCQCDTESVLNGDEGCHDIMEDLEKDLAKLDTKDQTAQTVSKKKIKKKTETEEEKKLVDLLVHVFDGLETPEMKMEALARKYIQLAADHKDTTAHVDELESKYRVVSKEKEILQSDFNKVNSVKTKLESLCRELQKHNKEIKEETLKRADEEDRKRKELSQKFQSTINDITTQMAENHKRNQQLKQDNSDLAQKLKGLVEQYEVREQHIEKVLKAKQLELQLCEAKLQQQTLLLQEERERGAQERQLLLQESVEQKKKSDSLVKQVAELKAQLALYTEKFEEFQTTLTKSNEVFATFKKEMEKMTKTIKKLEKESSMWKTRWENTNRSLLQMVDERTQKDNEIGTLKSKLEKLEKLCRALQGERKALKKQVEDTVQKYQRITPTSDQGSDASSPVSISPSPLETSTELSDETNQTTENGTDESSPVKDSGSDDTVGDSLGKEDEREVDLNCGDGFSPDADIVSAEKENVSQEGKVQMLESIVNPEN